VIAPSRLWSDQYNVYLRRQMLRCSALVFRISATYGVD